MDWQLQEAKNRLSLLVKTALKEGPQVITVRGERTVIILSAREYDSLTAARPNIVDHLLSGSRQNDELVEDPGNPPKSPYPKEPR